MNLGTDVVIYVDFLAPMEYKRRNVFHTSKRKKKHLSTVSLKWSIHARYYNSSEIMREIVVVIH